MHDNIIYIDKYQMFNDDTKWAIQSDIKYSVNHIIKTCKKLLLMKQNHFKTKHNFKDLLRNLILKDSYISLSIIMELVGKKS